MAAVAAAPLLVSVTATANGFCRIGPLVGCFISWGLMCEGMCGVPREPIDGCGTVGAAVAETVPPQQP
jgi:hypothetical protein